MSTSPLSSPLHKMERGNNAQEPISSPLHIVERGAGVRIIILIALAGFLFFFKLGSFSLYDAAETTYGEFIKQILKTGDWLTLHYNGAIIFDKPPLYFWLASLATFIFGFNEFAIRFWAAVAGVLTVVTTFYLGKSFYNSKVGFLSAIIMMTAFQALIQSRIAEIDILLVLLMTLSLSLFYRGYTSNKGNYYFFSYLAMALAMVTKGIIGVALPATGIFLFLLFKRELKKLFNMHLIAGFFILLLVGFPWYLIEWYLHGQKFLDFAMGFLFMSRFQSVVSGHPGPWYYYFIALLLGFAPWSHFLPYSLWRTWKNRINSPELLTLCYILPTFIVFSIAKTKLPNYILPLYPLLAITVGKLWHDFWLEKQADLKKGMSLSNLFFAIVVVLIIIGAILAGRNYSGPYQALTPNLLLLASVLTIGALLSISAYFLRLYPLSFSAITMTVFLITFILTTQTLPAVEKYKGTKELASTVSSTIKNHELIAAFDVGNRPGVVFYNSRTILFLNNENEAVDFLKQKKGYCFTSLAHLEYLKKYAQVLDQRGELAVLH